MIWNINKLDVCSALWNFKGTKVYILVLSKQFDEQGALLFSRAVAKETYKQYRDIRLKGSIHTWQ